jgi:hypothetical protein
VFWTVSSEVEHSFDVGRVRGSIPLPSTKYLHFGKSFVILISGMNKFLTKFFTSLFLFLAIFLITPSFTHPTKADVTCFEGCSQGFWKNHTEYWQYTDFSPATQLTSVFNLSLYPTLSGKTFLDALNFTSSVPAELLLKQTVAATLNATYDPSMNYRDSLSQIIYKVNTALFSQNSGQILSLKDYYDYYNNQFCPLEDPTVVTVEYFKAILPAGILPIKPLVTLTWKTAIEIDNVGFNLYATRTDVLDFGTAVKINSNLIPSKVFGQLMGATYTYNSAPFFQYYWLGALDTGNYETIYGPVKPTFN